MNRFMLLLHVVGVVVWVGGMFFAHFALRPSVASWGAPERLRLMQGVLKRFFTAAAIAVVLILLSGVALIGLMGGMKTVGLYVHLMLGIGLAMMAVFVHLYINLLPRLSRAVQAEDWPAGGTALGKIRALVHMNFWLGCIVIVVAMLKIGI